MIKYKKILFLATILTFGQNLFAQEVKNIDTLDTDDKYTKVILKDNFTYEYLEIPRPQINDSMLDMDNWESERIHAYRDVTKESLPNEVDLTLYDEKNSYQCPFVNRVTSGFKFRHGRNHNGTDIALNIGDTVRAAFDGKVRVVEVTHNSGGYGNLVVIRHPNGLETYYGHLTAHCVKENELVKAGEAIGLGGSTGRSTGPHLHFETRYQGFPFDAERIFDFTTGKIRPEIENNKGLFVLKKHYFNINSHYGMSEQESQSQTEAMYHKIRSGENLGVIARKYHTTVTRICRLNPGLTGTTILRIGQRIRVR